MKYFPSPWLCFLFLAAGYLFSLSADENPPLSFERLSVEQGLSQSIVPAITQDSRGFLWFGTEDGLNLYDGYSFTVLKNDPLDEHSLSYNQITTIFEDRSRVLWIGTFNGGLNRYILKKNRFVRYQHSVVDSNSLSDDIIDAITQDPSGALWIGTHQGLNKMVLQDNQETPPVFKRYFNHPADPGSLSHDYIHALAMDSSGTLWIGTERGLNCLTREQAQKSRPCFVHYQHNPDDFTSLSNDTIRTLYVDRSGTLWVGTNHGLNRLLRRPEKNYFQRYEQIPNNANSLCNNSIYTILEDHTGILWIGTDGGGLCRFDRTTGIFAQYRHNPMDQTSIAANEIRYLYQDRSGILWIGTYGAGVNKANTRAKRFLHYRPELGNPNSLNASIIWSIYEDREGILWIGTHGGGLNRFDRKRHQFRHYRADLDNPFGLSSDIVRLILPDPSGDLWFGTHGGGICRFNPATGRFFRFIHNPDDTSSLSHNEIRAMYLDHDGILWIGTMGGGLDRLDTKMATGRAKFIHHRHDPNNPHSLSNDFIRCFYEDSTGMVWMGTQGGGLNCYSRATGVFTHYHKEPGNPNSMNNDYVFCIHDDRKGSLWIGTWGGGLNRFDRHTGAFTHYTTREGLVNDAIYGILQDQRGYLWFSTNDGLGRFDPRSGEVKAYTISDGLQSNEFNGGCYFASPSGEMFFGGINGFNSFRPELIRDNPYVPPIVITSFRKLNKEVRFDRPVTEVREITLSHRDYYFSFEFAALDYTAPAKNHYAYKMEGLDDEWIAAPPQKRFAQYTTLGAGKYVFSVKGSNNDGVWNEEGVSISIIINPPFWGAWWFRAVVLAGVVVSAFFLYRRRLRIVSMAAELQAAHDMQMSIMPHVDPRIPGFDISGICIPANEVGGDFFDYIWWGGDRTKFGVLIGDVSGKAMRGAMTAVMACGILYAEAQNCKTIGEILSKANRLLYAKTDRQVFIALCMISYDMVAKEMTFANAGLIQPLLVSHGRPVFQDSVNATFPLGLLDSHEYKDAAIAIQPGDVLILQTDGIQEAQNHQREMYGEERLLELVQTLDCKNLSASHIRDAIIHGVQQFSGSALKYDDMTVIVIKMLE